MSTPRLPAGRVIGWFILIAAAAMQPAAAQLPTNDPPWLGDFAVFANRHFQFGLTTHGKIFLTPLRDNRTPVADAFIIPISIMVEEIRPVGKPGTRQVLFATLKSSQHATSQLEKTVFSGQLSGGASFEVCIEQKDGVISLGGGLLEAVKPQKYPLRFSLRVKFPPSYSSAKKSDIKGTKAFEKKLSSDRLNLTWTDGQHTKHKFGKAMDAASKLINGPGIAAAEVENSAYPGRKFRFTAAPNSVMTLSNEKDTPLHRGFAIHWTPDATKDALRTARLHIKVR